MRWPRASKRGLQHATNAQSEDARDVSTALQNYITKSGRKFLHRTRRLQRDAAAVCENPFPSFFSDHRGEGAPSELLEFVCECSKMSDYLQCAMYMVEKEFTR